MKLAEALSLRADLQKRIAQMETRLENSCKVQEGDIPAEDPKELFNELDNELTQLESLIFRINKTNMQSLLSNGESMTKWIARRDVLKKHITILQSVLDTATERGDRYSRQEIRFERIVDVPTLRKQVSDLSRQLRETDVEIQSANWNIEICE